MCERAISHTLQSLTSALNVTIFKARKQSHKRGLKQKATLRTKRLNLGALPIPYGTISVKDSYCFDSHVRMDLSILLMLEFDLMTFWSVVLMPRCKYTNYLTCIIVWDQSGKSRVCSRTLGCVLRMGCLSITWHLSHTHLYPEVINWMRDGAIKPLRSVVIWCNLHIKNT